MAGVTKVYRETVKVPISITWSQELVDDGPGGEDFYLRISPHINLGGKSGMPRLVVSDENRTMGPTIRTLKEYNKAINNNFSMVSKIKKVAKKAEDDSKKILMGAVKKGFNSQQKVAESTKPANMSTLHQEKLRSVRLKTATTAEDRRLGEEVRKAQEDSKAVTLEDLSKRLSPEEMEFARQLAGKSSAYKELKELVGDES